MADITVAFSGGAEGDCVGIAASITSTSSVDGADGGDDRCPYPSL